MAGIVKLLEKVWSKLVNLVRLAAYEAHKRWVEDNADDEDQLRRDESAMEYIAKISQKVSYTEKRAMNADLKAFEALRMICQHLDDYKPESDARWIVRPLRDFKS